MPTISGIPALSIPKISGGFPLHFIVSPLTLTVLLALVGMFLAVISVVLIYHWRRFPFEYDTFHWAERIYLFGVVAGIAAALLGIFISA